jgi:hypothetical protein
MKYVILLAFLAGCNNSSNISYSTSNLNKNRVPSLRQVNNDHNNVSLVNNNIENGLRQTTVQPWEFVSIPIPCLFPVQVCAFCDIPKTNIAEKHLLSWTIAPGNQHPFNVLVEMCRTSPGRDVKLRAGTIKSVLARSKGRILIEEWRDQYKANLTCILCGLMLDYNSYEDFEEYFVQLEDWYVALVERVSGKCDHIWNIWDGSHIGEHLWTYPASIPWEAFAGKDIRPFKKLEKDDKETLKRLLQWNAAIKDRDVGKTMHEWDRRVSAIRELLSILTHEPENRAKYLEWQKRYLLESK